MASNYAASARADVREAYARGFELGRAYWAGEKTGEQVCREWETAGGDYPEGPAWDAFVDAYNDGRDAIAGPASVREAL